MVRIAICDDDQKHCGRIREMLARILFSRCEYFLESFEDGRQVMEAIERGCFTYDLLLLDIHMKMDGLSTAEYIRHRNIDIDIIFVTVSTEHVFDGYLYKAYSYLLKPVTQEKLERDIIRYLNEKDQEVGSLQVTIRGEIKRIPLDKILYFESSARKVYVITEKEEIAFYGKLDEIEKNLDGTFFFRCHQSYIVNMRKARSLSRSGVRVENNMVPVSRKYYDSLKSLF